MYQIHLKTTEEFSEKFRDFSLEQKKCIGASLSKVIGQEFIPIVIVQPDVTLTPEGVYIVTLKNITLAEANKATEYMLLKIHLALNETVLGKFFRVSYVARAVEAGNFIYDPTKAFTNLYNSDIHLVFSPDSPLPERFCCGITRQLMDDPVFLRTNPLVHYERAALSEWVLINNTDPTTREAVRFLDIFRNCALQTTIRAFVEDTILGNDLSKYFSEAQDIATQTERSDEDSAAASSSNPAFF